MSIHTLAAEAEQLAYEMHKLNHLLRVINDEVVITSNADLHGPVFMDIGLGIARDVENRLDELVARLDSGN